MQPDPCLNSSRLSGKWRGPGWPRLRRRRWRWPVVAALAALASVGAAGRSTELSVAPPTGAIVLFDGTDTSRWVKRGGDRPIPWKVADGAMTVGGGDIMTRDAYDSFQLHVEFMVPDMPKARGQAKGNSGVYLQGRYEIQVLDSYGLAAPGEGDCGALYGQAAPLVNACKPPLQWQSYDIVFRAPRFDTAGAMVEKARVTVLHNGITVQNNTEVEGPTRAGLNGDLRRPGPLLLQDHRNPVRYRNIWILPLPARAASQ